MGDAEAGAPLQLLVLCGSADVLELDPSGKGAAPQVGGMCSSVASGGPRPLCAARDVQSEPWAWEELTGLSRDLLGGILWENVLEGRGVPESWIISKDHFFQTQ